MSFLCGGEDDGRRRAAVGLQFGAVFLDDSFAERSPWLLPIPAQEKAEIARSDS